MQTTYDKVVSVCSYCGSGCQIEFTVDKKANRIISAKGAPLFEGVLRLGLPK